LITSAVSIPGVIVNNVIATRKASKFKICIGLNSL
jgi:hypothetical protein